MEDVFLLSNEPAVRQNSIDQREISWDNHISWFMRAIADPNVCFLIVIGHGGDFWGQVRLQLDNLLNGKISISITETIRGKSRATEILERATGVFFSRYPNLITILAQIRTSNVASIRVFSKASFVVESEFEIDGSMYTQMKRMRSSI